MASYRPQYKSNSSMTDLPLDAETVSGHSVGYIELTDQSSSGTLTVAQLSECLKDIAIIKLISYKNGSIIGTEYLCKENIPPTITSSTPLRFKSVKVIKSVQYHPSMRIIDITNVSTRSYQINATSFPEEVYANPSSSPFYDLTSLQVGNSIYGVQPPITGGATTITDTDLTANKALVSDLNGKVAVSNVSLIELGYLSGVTSAIQTQINNKTTLNEVYPVGAIYMSVNSTSPASLFGGTWEQLKDKFLLGAGDTYSNGSTGGEATHTLTENEMPRHNHKARSLQSSGSAMGSTLNTNDIWSNYIESSETSFTGGNAPHNNMPPYLVVYMWKRTA